VTILNLKTAITALFTCEREFFTKKAIVLTAACALAPWSARAPRRLKFAKVSMGTKASPNIKLFEKEIKS
jgi:hypothetical protein